MRAFACIALALPLLIATTVADAQQSAGTKQQSAAKNRQANAQALAARRECFAEAKVRAPGAAEASAGLASLRENAYRDCAARKGIAP
jgi:hypothetical protein